MSSMEALFVAARGADAGLLAELTALAPDNPFATPAYAAARQRLGDEPWTLGVARSGRLVTGCAAFARSGRLQRSLDITSLPELPEPEPFWRGLLALCRRERMTQLEVGSFGSRSTTIPSLPGEQSRRQRCEYVLALRADDLSTLLTRDHRRNVARARKRGLTVRRALDASACAAHARVIGASMQRRHRRGESVPLDFPDDEARALVQEGAGELFQALEKDDVLSSMLLLRSPRAGYSQTMGTSAEGMKCGASRLVVFEAALALQADGATHLNLGGAGDEHAGLREFKAGFGAQPVALESASFSFAHPVRRMMSRAVRRLRESLGR